MSHTIPGTQRVEGREYMYIESPEGESFHELAAAAFAACPGLGNPSTGGLIEEHVRVEIDGGISLVGLSYKGDIDGWRKKLVEFCLEADRHYGFVENDRLLLSNGKTPLLDELGFSLLKV